MHQLQYKDFSLSAHQKNWRIKNPNVCQFELTFKCSLHCRHCYSDCYNNDDYTKNEINTNAVKLILDKVFEMGALWLCFTGGDPLEREDFLEIYSYAKRKGFIITIFTTGCSMTEDIAGCLAKKPPFVIELTINAVTEKTYEKITQVNGSFKRAMHGLGLVLKKNLPLKVKTMATKQNFNELTGIKEFLKQRKIDFRPDRILHARLNGDTGPCNLRLEPEDFRRNGVKNEDDSSCRVWEKKDSFPKRELFNCAFGSPDGLNIDPYGNIFPCSCIRKPAISFLNSSIEDIKKFILNDIAAMRNIGFKPGSKCLSCNLFNECLRCPGSALLETGRLDGQMDYFCKLAARL